MLLLDLSHTSHTRAQTGIQRVCRALAAELARSGETQAVCFDPHQHGWRALNAAERNTLAERGAAAGSRGAKWSLTQKLLGRAKRLAGRRTRIPAGDALICPELFSTKVGAHLPELFAEVRGPRLAIFHDAIGLKFPELTPPATVARLPAYLRELARFDGVAAVSEDSASALREWWAWTELKDAPPVRAIPLGLEPVQSYVSAPAAKQPRVLCVSTIEGRKNHAALLDAAESLWNAGVGFELELIGMPRADTGAAALGKIRALQAAGRPLIFHGAVTEENLHAAYAGCAFTVYPSLYEGFGLPVFESLQHGRPCICSSGGALGEAARGGGVLVLPALTGPALARAMRRLFEQPRELAALAAAARGRKFRSWSDYAAELRIWLRELPRRS
ncbi:MAG: glycosyltransferase family 1 protein [Opitutus sp.]|nr:glycosyltransferase family 1 protein [Opitutus sp.]